MTRDEAKEQAEKMYTGNEYVTSQLMSSYAYDTALNFICQNSEHGYILAITKDNTYGNIGTNAIKLTGEYEADNYSNIHDFLGNCSEWTTEYSTRTYSGVPRPCVVRGGDYGYSDGYAAFRIYTVIELTSSDDSFRVSLYV